MSLWTQLSNPEKNNSIMKPVNHKERSSALGKFIAAYTITALLSIAAVAFIFSSFKVVEGESSVSQREVNELRAVLNDMEKSFVGINVALDDGADLSDLFTELGQIRNTISGKNVYNSSNETLRSIGRDIETVLINYRSLLNRYMQIESRLSAVQSDNPCEEIERRFNNLNEDYTRLQADFQRQLASAQGGGGGGSRVEERIPDGFVNDFLQVIEEMAGESNQRGRNSIGMRSISNAKNAGYLDNFSDKDKITKIENTLR